MAVKASLALTVPCGPSQSNSLAFICLFWGVLGLRFPVQAISSCSKRGMLFVIMHGLLIAMVASLVAEPRRLIMWTSVAVVLGL